MKNLSREDKINNCIVGAVLSNLPWVFVVREHEIIPIVMVIQMFLVLAYGLWNEFYVNSEEEEENVCN